MFKTITLLGLLGVSVASESSIRGASEEEALHLDLEVVNENGDRELFPLLPGVKCPTGFNCQVHNAKAHNANSLATSLDLSPMTTSLQKSIKTPLAMTLDWKEFDDDMKTLVSSDNKCSRRAAMTRAAGLVAGLSVAAVNKPAYAAETKEVKMGSDSGLLAFVPQKTTICSGDSVKWINNKGGPHNVVFDEEGVPSGVNYEDISMFDQMGEEDETFTMKFESKGEYAYYCEPHRGAGMNGVLIVT